jgi:hypothetical protein
MQVIFIRRKMHRWQKSLAAQSDRRPVSAIALSIRRIPGKQQPMRLKVIRSQEHDESTVPD